MTHTNNPTEQNTIRFGDYVSIEEKRYVGENEWFTYKVIDVLESNSWRTVPVDARKQEAELHDYTELIVKVICDLPGNEKIERFRAADVRKQVRHE